MASLVAAWPMVTLGSVMRKSDSWVDIDSNQEYAQITVRLWGKGVVLRGKVIGAEIAAARQLAVRPQQFILSRIDARNGAFGLVPTELDGAVVSSDFPTFNLNTQRILPTFLEWMSKTHDFVEACKRASEGTTNRVRLNEEAFLATEVSLPPLDEQRRIVARIVALAARIAEARGLRREAVVEGNVLLLKAAEEAFTPYSDRYVSIGDKFRVTTGSTPSRSNEAYWGGDIKWISSGEVAFRRISDTAEKITEEGLASSSAKVYPPGTVLLAMIGQGKTRGQCAVLDCNAATNQNVAGIHVYNTGNLPEYVYWWLRSRYLQSRVSETGTAQPALSGERIRLMPIPLPHLKAQHDVVTFLESIESQVIMLQRLQTLVNTELDALLPSILDRAFRGEL